MPTAGSQPMSWQTSRKSPADEASSPMKPRAAARNRASSRFSQPSPSPSSELKMERMSSRRCHGSSEISGA
eukprot:2041887-Lingulodinium_polyedra.AAC.1